MSAAAPVRASKPPKPRDLSVRGTFENYTKDQVAAMKRKTNWAVVSTRLLADVHRVVDAPSWAGVISWVEAFTNGRLLGPGDNGKFKIGDPRKKAPSHTPNLITSDLAKLIGIGKRQAQKAVVGCLAAGFIRNCGKTGVDRVRFCVDYDALEKAENAKDPEEVERATEARVRAQVERDLRNSRSASEGGEEGGGGEYHSTENEEVRRGGCGTGVPHLGGLVGRGRGPQRVATFDGPEGRMNAHIESNLTELATITVIPQTNGDLVFRLDPAPESPVPTAPVGEPEDFVETVVKPKAELKAGLEKHFGSGVTEELMGRLPPMPKGCTPKQALAVVKERVERPGAKPLTLAMLPKFFATDVAERWNQRPPTKQESNFARRYREKQERFEKEKRGRNG